MPREPPPPTVRRHPSHAAVLRRSSGLATIRWLPGTEPDDHPEPFQSPFLVPLRECTPDDGGTSVESVRCPACSSVDDKVIDSRMADDGSAIRRRRECLSCGRRFTTFERSEELPLSVLKRSGDRVPFDRSKVEAGISAAAKGRPLQEEQITRTAEAIEEQVRMSGSEVTSEQVGLAVLDHLRELDHVAYLRFASVYKGFDDAADFQREVKLLTKATEPKRH